MRKNVAALFCAFLSVISLHGLESQKEGYVAIPGPLQSGLTFNQKGIIASAGCIATGLIIIGIGCNYKTPSLTIAIPAAGFTVISTMSLAYFMCKDVKLTLFEALRDTQRQQIENAEKLQDRLIAKMKSEKMKSD